MERDGERTERGNLDEATAGGGGPLAAPDEAGEPEDEAVHLRRPQRDLHHRPPADGEDVPGRLRGGAEHGGGGEDGPLRRQEDAGAGGGGGGGPAGRRAVRA